jgi:hypothetical protein
MKKLIYTAAVVLSLGVLSSCTKDNDVAPASINKTMGSDARDKSDVGTADATEARDKSDVGTADATNPPKTMTADARDKSDVGTADARDKSDVGTADANGGNGGN